MKQYIIIVLLILVILLWLKTRKDNFTNLQAIENIASVYADSSGTMIVNNVKALGNIYSDRIKTGYIDISGNMDISGNIRILGNIDISGSINSQGKTKEYLSASYSGQFTPAFFKAVNDGVNGTTYSPHFPILQKTWYVPETFQLNKNLRLDISKAITYDPDNGWFNINPNKLYRIEVHMHVNVYDIQSSGDMFYSRLKAIKPDNTTTDEIAVAEAAAYDDRTHITLTTIAITSGYNKVFPTLQKNNDWFEFPNANTISTTVVITEM